MKLVIAVLALLSCSREPETAAPPSRVVRIVSLTPSATEIVAALGLGSNLVGVDDYSKYPPGVDQLPKVGSFLTPNLEAIVRMTPSFVVVDDIHGRTTGALRDAKIDTIGCPMHTLPDVKQCLRTVGTRVGTPAAADRVIAEIETALDATAARRPAKRPRVLLIIDRETGGVGNLVAAGPGSWLDELLAVAGGENVLSASGVRYPKVSLEEVLRGKPDVIIDVSYASEEGGIGPWDAVEVPAVKAKRVRGLADQYLRAPSPRVKEALITLEKALAP